MIIKKMRSRPHSRPKNGKGAPGLEISGFEGPRQDNSRNRPHNGHGNRNYQQLYDKYTNLARDALLCGDRVAAEFHYQYADHYLRLLNERQQHRSHHVPAKPPATGDEVAPIEMPPVNRVDSSMGESSASQ